jgi:esterase/lipase superfamily enzyme
MSREVAELWSDALGARSTVIRYGHWGRPVLVFPSEQGRARDFENNGMIAAVAGLIDAGRVPTTGRPGAPRWRTTCRGSADDGSPH